MTRDEALALKAGDLVTCPSWGGDTAEIERVDGDLFQDPVAFFVGGGFWRTSKLVRANAISS